MHRNLKPQNRWVVLGGCCFAFLSAAVNAGFLLKLGTSVGHLTGDVSRVAMDSVMRHDRAMSAAANLLIATVGFVLGATGAGYFIHHPNLNLTRPYGRAVCATGVLLLGAHHLIGRHPLGAIALASMSCGLQNALATHYRGMVLRTTHLTGLLTDLGTNLGMKLKGHRIHAWKLLVPASIAFSFFAGAAFGSILVFSFRAPFLLILACIYLAGGICWTLYKHWYSQSAQTEAPSYGSY
ncbi:MAG: YoaK family protein [Kiritimatiellia bacterium]